MKPGASFLLAILFLTAVYTPNMRAGTPKVGDRLARQMAVAQPGEGILVWVFFTDKGSHELRKLSLPTDVVTERSIRRRLNVLPPDRVVDETDLPVEEAYVAEIASRVLTVRQRSKWFNAVSALATPGQIAQLASLPFVQTIDLLARFGIDRRREQPAPSQVVPPAGLPRGASVHALDYGPSLTQVTVENIPALHDMGNYAQGVIVGSFDNGFRLLNHEAFDSLHIIATHDFVDHKVSVVPNNPDANYGGHGVATLSTLAGYRPGEIIGPAFGASFILARTENDSSETPIEEDNWVSAIEWADSLGVQVTSTSLGYLTFDSPYTSLSWQDMDGRTAVISLAATMAARKGIVVLNSTGNSGQVGTHNTLGAPADADSILSVGAVSPAGVVASFSSMGPTIDGRIKPDILAQGTNVYTASATDPLGYYTSQAGTSFACPLAAGVAALLVSAFPHATPMHIDSAMKLTASRFVQSIPPDNIYGWGIVDAQAAYNFLRQSDTSVPPAPGTPARYSLAQNFPNPFPSPFNPTTIIMYDLPEAAHVTLEVFDILGRKVKTLVDADQAPQTGHLVKWDGTNTAGVAVASGSYIYWLRASGETSGRQVSLAKKMFLVR